MMPAVFMFSCLHLLHTINYHSCPNNFTGSRLNASHQEPIMRWLLISYGIVFKVVGK